MNQKPFRELFTALELDPRPRFLSAVDRTVTGALPDSVSIDLRSRLIGRVLDAQISESRTERL